MKESLKKTLDDWHKISHDFFLFILFVSLHDLLEQASYDLEVFRDDVARSDLLHTEHEDREESMLNFRVIRMLQSLFSNGQD